MPKYLLKRKQNNRTSTPNSRGSLCKFKSTSNENFFDLFIVGEAEVVMDELLDTYLELENPKNDLEAFLDIEGIYIPDHPVKMVTVPDLRDACHPIRQIVPETDMKKNTYQHLVVHFC